MTSNEIIESVRAIVNGGTPEHDISDILWQHRCFFLLSKLPSNPYKQRLELEGALNRIAIKERYKAGAPLFEKIDFPYAVIKGAVLSESAYCDPFARSSGDIDILIRRQDADKIKSLLLSLGFIQGRVTDNGIVPFTRREILFQTAMSHQTAPYIKQTDNRLCPYVNLDVNMDVMWGESDERVDAGKILACNEDSSLFGITFRKLTDEAGFISLCLHHYKDMNSLYLLSGGSLKLSLFCDIYYYLKNVHPNVQELAALCKEMNVGKYVYVCIEYTKQIFDGEFDEYLDCLESTKDASLLNSFGLNDKERKAWNLTLPERLFLLDLPRYVFDTLNESEKAKVEANMNYM